MKIPLLIAATGFCASIIFSFLIFPVIKEPLNLNIDPDRYGELANNLYSGIGFKYSDSLSEVLDKPPLYPYIISIIYFLIGNANYIYVQIFQAILHSITGLLTFLFIRNYVNVKVALISQTIVALHPVLLWYTSRIWIETVYTLLFVCCCIFYINTYKSLNTKNTILAGAFTGLVLLTKSVLLLFPFILLIWFSIKKGIRGAFAVLIIIFISALVIFPWAVRNYKLSKSFIPVNLSLGQNLILGDALAENWKNEPLSNLASWEKGNLKMKSILNNQDQILYNTELEKQLIRYHFQKMWSEPEFFFKRTAINFLAFWYISESPLKSILFFILQIPILIFILLNYEKVRLYNCDSIIILIIVYYSIVHSFIIGWARYSVPLIPLMVILVGLIINGKYFKYHLDK